jgi:hypothetical protein
MKGGGEGENVRKKGSERVERKKRIENGTKENKS